MIPIFFLLFIIFCPPDPIDLMPVLYQGRYRPLKVVCVLEKTPLENFLNSDSCKVLPQRNDVWEKKAGEWLPLTTLKRNSQNTTPYSDPIFSSIKEAYLNKNYDLLAQSLITGFKSIAHHAYKEGKFQKLRYPYYFQLQLEVIYYNIPLFLIALLLYLSAPLFLLSKRTSSLFFIFLVTAFTLHSLTLLIRSAILFRPPVSNMGETLLFVPWVSGLGAYWMFKMFKTKIPLVAHCLMASILFIILQTTMIEKGLENVQAVLNSQLWLTIHVLMVVGSYGIFLLGGLLGHFFLLLKEGSKYLITTGKLIVQLLILGLALLIPGTILGGVWAAQSWGRFWDWDPKESWAFISCSVYLIALHLFLFKKINYRGIAIFSILGFLAITFTWYGVNYILATGFHSYGFGNGGEIYYYLFLLIELIFSGIMASKINNSLIFSFTKKRLLQKKRLY